MQGCIGGQRVLGCVNGQGLEGFTEGQGLVVVVTRVQIGGWLW